MLVSINALLESLNELQSALPSLDNPKLVAASDLAFELLRDRERRGGAAIVARFDRLAALSRRIAGPGGRALADRCHAEARLCAMQPLTLSEERWRDVRHAGERLLGAALLEPAVNARTRTRHVQDSLDWEIADLVIGSVEGGKRRLLTCQVDAVEAYLRHVLQESDLSVRSLEQAGEGYGKRTLLMDVLRRGRAEGLVLRAEHGERPLFDKDCHVLSTEAALLRWLGASGAPVPPLLYCGETAPDIGVIGPHLIMARMPGLPAGGVIGGGAGMTDDLLGQIARTAAGLHSLPLSAGVAQLSGTINERLAAAPLSDVIVENISGWRDYWRSNHHIGSPALAALYDWLLHNVPVLDSLRPVLLHGDFGLNNILVEDGRISAIIDWEAAHLGDPAEDLAFLKRSMGQLPDWAAFEAQYQAAGGATIDERRMIFAELMAITRGATICNLATAALETGAVTAIRMLIPAHVYIPYFFSMARDLIHRFEAFGEPRPENRS